MVTKLEILNLVIDNAWKGRMLARPPRAAESVIIELPDRNNEPVMVEVRQGETKVWFPREQTGDGKLAREFDRDTVYVLTESARTQIELSLSRLNGRLIEARVRRVRALGVETRYRAPRTTRAILIS